MSKRIIRKLRKIAREVEKRCLCVQEVRRSVSPRSDRVTYFQGVKTMAKTIGKVPEKMNAQLDAGGAPFWSPEEVGDEIGGTVITVADTTSVKFPSKGTFKVITVGTADGDYRIDCGGAVLKRLVGDLAPKPGDFIAVRYLGEGPDKKAGNKPCQRFGMVVERVPEE